MIPTYKIISEHFVLETTNAFGQTEKEIIRAWRVANLAGNIVYIIMPSGSRCYVKISDEKFKEMEDNFMTCEEYDLRNSRNIKLGSILNN